MEVFDMLVFFAFASTVLSVRTSAGSKRLLLHSDDDVVNAITSLQAKYNAMEAEMTSLKSTMSALPTNGGSTFVRWGRTSCPGNGTDFVYKGYMAGNQWNQYGGGSNLVCLPEDPTWDQYTDGFQTGARVHGTEIEVTDALSSVLFGKHVDNQDIPCAVCRSPRVSHVMIPARASCYPSWALEYHGYLASSAQGWHASSNFVCLDSGIEFVPHGAGNDNENVLNVVEVQCGSLGSLPCPPYVDGRELACVVCTK